MSYLGKDKGKVAGPEGAVGGEGDDRRGLKGPSRAYMDLGECFQVSFYRDTPLKGGGP